MGIVLVFEVKKGGVGWGHFRVLESASLACGWLIYKKGSPLFSCVSWLHILEIEVNLDYKICKNIDYMRCFIVLSCWFLC